ncbi:hypothetical protein AVEN_20102-1 [Araneus ventricosus]|uniref:Uncharacterized protein n=1 Tax=Araneus ventricosus TaxID=182803 RepID=A0A4Y2M4B5_ARAVE|nr:hypothetical protein AVEN_20102-1 [Araneus ventricosus]
MDRILWRETVVKKLPQKNCQSAGSEVFVTKLNIHQQKVRSVLDILAPILCTLNSQRITKSIIAEVNSSQLQRFTPALRQKQPVLINRNRMVLFQGIASPYSAKTTKEVINTLDWEVLSHLPHSLEIVPSDNHLFMTMDNHFRGQ